MPLRQRQNPQLRQTELFELATNRPKWSDIPMDVRTAATELVARMLRQSRELEALHEKRGSEHE